MKGRQGARDAKGEKRSRHQRGTVLYTTTSLYNTTQMLLLHREKGN